MKIILATNNEHKISEIKNILGEGFDVLSLKEVGIDTDIEENGQTLQENSYIKAAFVADSLEKSGYPQPFTVAADDTGLEVEALNGAPGVHSARYAEGTDHNSEANMMKLLHELEEKENRKACFRTVISLIESAEPTEEQEAIFFEGRVDGVIMTEKHGSEGFGYDPIFQPDGYDKSFAELGLEIKNKISHRARAIEKLAAFLKNEK